MSIPIKSIVLHSLPRTLGVSPSHIAQLARAGIVLSVGRNKYASIASVKGYMEMSHKTIYPFTEAIEAYL